MDTDNHDSSKLSLNLTRYLEKDEFEDSLNYMGLHGFITGVIVSRENCELEAILSEILDQPALWSDEAEKQLVLGELESLYSTLMNRFFLNEEITLPCSFFWDDGLEGSDLESWTEGFLEAVLTEEENLLQDENEEFDFILPLLVISGLFDEEEEDLVKLRSSEKFITDAINDIPELLTDFYLYLRRE